MKKSLFIILAYILMSMISCNKSSNFENNIVLKKPLATIVDSFTNLHPDKNTYELYINKVDPHNGVLMLFAGEESLTKSENQFNHQKSLVHIISNNVEIDIYTGLERYTIGEDRVNEVSSIHPSNQELEKVLWVITDSFNVLKVYQEYEVAYPFMPLPRLYNKNLFSAPDL